MGKITVKHSLQVAFAELGAEMRKDSCGLFVARYNSMEYFIEVDENDGTFCVLQTVMGINGELSRRDFDTMLEVVKHFHNEYNGEWNDGLSYVYSPWYSVRCHEFGSKDLEKIVNDFFDVWSFACANACMLTDASIWK